MPNSIDNVNIAVTFRHTESTPALKSYAIEKLQSRLQKYIHSPGDVHVVLAVEKLDHIAEVQVHAKGYEASARAVTQDLYSAIDKVVDTIESQLRKKKDRSVSNRHQVLTPEVEV